jgi:hypothetical protein
MRKHDNSIPLVLCGGHAATTALATIYALRTLETSVLHFDLHFIGASTAIEGKKVATLEQKVFPGLGVRLHAIYSGKLSRRFSIWAIVSFCKIPFGFIHAFFLLLLIRPKAILSFGGYSALPLVIVGKLLGIVIGSLLGANTAQLAMGWTTATFGIHEYTKDEMKQREATGLIHWPTMQLACMAPLVVLQAGVIFTGFAALGTSLLIFTLTGWRELSFTMKSRAGNRDNERYLNWTSVFSNGVWYIALAPLALNGIHWDKALPYVAGAGMGSLIGQLVSMRAERILDARMDAHDSVVQSDARTVTA